MLSFREVTRGLALLAAMLPALAGAAVYPLPPADVDLIGEVKTVKVQEGETLLDIGRRYGVGYEEMRQANPNVDIWVPGVGTEVTLPLRRILPSGPREGLVLNVAEMRLYYYPPAEKGKPATVETYPVSIGRMDWRTPLGETRIVSKQKNPTWYLTENIKSEWRKDGRNPPDFIPPGPDNPLGAHVLRLGLPTYLIHGTNNPWGIGMRVTHGCVRMYPEDISSLFDRVPVNTKVRIVNEPVKLGWFAGQLYIEAHPELEEHRDPELEDVKPVVEKVAAALSRHTTARVDYRRIRQAASERMGMPVAISRQGS